MKILTWVGLVFCMSVLHTISNVSLQILRISFENVSSVLSRLSFQFCPNCECRRQRRSCEREERTFPRRKSVTKKYTTDESLANLIRELQFLIVNWKMTPLGKNCSGYCLEKCATLSSNIWSRCVVRNVSCVTFKRDYFWSVSGDDNSGLVRAPYLPPLKTAALQIKIYIATVSKF